MVRSALERPTAEGLVTLHDGHRLYSVDTLTPVGRVYRLIRTVIHCGYEPGERFMTRFETTIVTACAGVAAGPTDSPCRGHRQPGASLKSRGT